MLESDLIDVQPRLVAPPGGEMGRRIAAKDWARTPLGPRAGWPASLRIAVDICLHSRFPMCLWWGSDLVSLYNDAYGSILAERHPRALGESAPSVWADIWDVLEPEVEAVLRRGESTWSERVRLVLDRGGRPEEAFFSWSYSPIFDESGEVAGLLGTVLEETGRVRTEKALGETQRKLDAALLAGEVGTFEWDVINDRLYGDQNFADIFGVPLDAEGAAPLNVYMAAIHPDDQRRVVDLVRRSVETGCDYHAEYRVMGDGRVRWVLARGKPERDADGCAVRFPGVVLDVTERREVEDALRKSESKYRALFESMADGFCIIQVLFDEQERPVDYRFLEGNPAWELHTGLQGALGRTAREVLPDLEEHWFDIYGRVARSREPVRFESGSEAMGRWFDVYAFPVEEPASCKVALLFKDISEQKRTDQALRESGERFRSVLENSLDAAYRRDLRTDTYDYLSPAVEEVFGIDAEEMRALSVPGLLERVHPEDRDRTMEAIETGMTAGKGRVEYRFRRADGKYRWLADNYTVQSDECGTPIFRTGIVRDITERKGAEEERERLLGEAEAARVDAEAANRAKADFLAAMSHELRTPLNAIGGYVDLLALGIHGPVAEPQQTALSRITANQRHLLALINDILQFAKVEAGQVELDLRPLRASELLLSVEPLVAPTAAAKGVAYSTHELDPALTLIADEERVRQIVLNLVTNGIKFTPSGGWVLLSCEADANWLSIRVRDNGRGIAPEKQKAIFDPFVQVDRRLNRPHDGVGLGLAISRDLARAMGGDLLVESAPDQGSLFTLRLPRGAPEAEAD